jgi:hypothetical protein
VWTGVGLVLMAAGLVAVIVPGHLTFAAMGLVVVLRNSIQAKRIFLKLQRRRPDWVLPLRRLLSHKPEVWPPIRRWLARLKR